jgi:hypothetical protein
MTHSTLARPSPSLPIDLSLAACLIGLVTVARAMPHAADFVPVVASALFAGMVFRSRILALLVPVAAMLLSDLVVGWHDWRVMIVVYAALIVPALLGLWGRRHRGAVVLLPLALGSSLIFFIASNFAVWAFSGMYAHDLDGLVRCYLMALPFLRDTLTGDVLWTAALFGAWWLAQVISPATQPSPDVPAA